jgi:hypothetical protein
VKAGFRGGWIWHRPATAEGDTSAVSAQNDESAATKRTDDATKRTEGVSVSDVSPSADLSPSAGLHSPKGTVSPSSPSLKVQQIIPIREGDSRMSTRARVACRLVGDSEPLPAWVTEPLEPDFSDPIGAHDDEP